MSEDLNFEKALAQTLKNEGVIGNKTGYVNAKTDSGGETNYGITIAKARECGYKGKMCDLPYDTAAEIYRTEYWIKTKAHKIQNFAIAFLLFDFAVNAGVQNACKKLQTALNKVMGVMSNKLTIDGIIGQKTLAELDKIQQCPYWYHAKLEKVFIAEILSYYTSLKSTRTGFAVNGAGWTNRIVKNIRFLAGV